MALGLAEPDSLTPPIAAELLTADSIAAAVQRTNAPDAGLWLVAVAAGKIVGSLELTPYRNQALRHALALGMSVRADSRRQGIGSALLAEAVAWAREQDRLRRIELEVLQGNEGASALYRKHGFVVEGTHPGRYILRGWAVSSQRMALTLRPPG